MKSHIRVKDMIFFISLRVFYKKSSHPVVPINNIDESTAILKKLYCFIIKPFYY